MNLDIPGFYFDPIKKKHFRITNEPISGAQLQPKGGSLNYSISSLRSLDQKLSNSMKKELLNSKIQSQTRCYETEITGINKFMYPNYGIDKDIYDYRIRKLEPVSENFKLSTFDKPCLISTSLKEIINNSTFMISSLNNIYKVSLENQTEQLIHRRSDKTHHSTLRAFQISPNLELIARQWFEENEKSEVEILNLSNHQAQTRIISEEREWFNSMLLEQTNHRLQTVSNNAVKIFDLKNLLNAHTKIKSKHDILCIDSNNKNRFSFVADQYSLIGTRNGILQKVDSKSGKLLNLNYQKKSLKSIINIKYTGLNEFIMSTLGESLMKFDERNLSEPILEFETMKNSQNVFGKEISIHNDRYIICQFNDTIEIFSIYQSIPLKTIDISSFLKVHGSNCMTNVLLDRNNELVFFGKSDTENYKLYRFL